MPSPGLSLELVNQFLLGLASFLSNQFESFALTRYRRERASVEEMGEIAWS